MNAEELEANWWIFKGKVKEQWGKLTDDDLEMAEGKLDQLAGRIGLKYGLAKEEAYRRLQSLNEESRRVS